MFVEKSRVEVLHAVAVLDASGSRLIDSSRVLVVYTAEISLHGDSRQDLGLRNNSRK